MSGIELHTRYVTIGGHEYDDGKFHIKVMPRTFRIREFEDSQIELRMFLSFMAGVMLSPTINFVVWIFTR